MDNKILFFCVFFITLLIILFIFTNSLGPMKQKSELKRLKLLDLQNILLWCFNLAKRPTFLPLRAKDRPSSINLVQILSKESNMQQRIKTRYKTKYDLKLSDSLPFQSLLDCILKDIEPDSILASYEFINKENIKYIPRIAFEKLFNDDIFINSAINLPLVDFSTYFRPKAQSPYEFIALDVEKVTTINGQKLGRVTIVNHLGMVIYDKIVKPKEKILNYETKYSGLTEEIIKTGVSFEEVKNDVKKIIGVNTICIGHGIENDLCALEIYHDNVIDTAYIFLNSQGRKISLKQLAKNHLKKEIHMETHDSAEDALITLQLLSIKIQQVIRFLDPNRNNIKLEAEINYKTANELDNSTENTLSLVKCEYNDLVTHYQHIEKHKTLSMFLYEDVDNSVYLSF